MKNNDIIQTIESCPVADMFQEKELNMSGRKCSFEDCTKKHDSHGFCSNHAFQFRKYGHPLTKEEKHENNSKAAKARLKKYGHHNLGKRWALSEEKKNKKGVTYNTGRTHFKKGHVTHNTGKSDWMTPEHKEKLRQANIGRAPWNKGTVGIMKAWNKIGDGITPASKIERDRFAATIRDLVFQRDNYTCQFCDQYSGYLHVDHIKEWANHPELRFDLDNCRTLCVPCHYYITFKKKMPQGSKWGLTTMAKKEG